MTLLILSFVAGILTVLAPCILPLLPVVIGGSIARNEKNSWYRPLIIAGSLVVSVILFTLLLKASTSLLGVPTTFWQVFSGGVIFLLGINFLFPSLWKKLPIVAKFNIGSNTLFSKSFAKKGVGGDVLTGFALGPVFSSCSPTYALIVASVLPASFFQGLLYLLAYSVGLAGTLLIIAYAGQAAARKLGWLSNPSGLFSRVIGVLFVLVGIFVLFGFDKKVQTYVLDQGWYDPISKFEQSIER